MPTYIALLRYTRDGIEAIREDPARVDAMKDAIAAAGGKLMAFYLTVGQYDAVAIAEFPNDEAAAASILSSGSRWTETLRAFTLEEYRKMAAERP